MDRLTRVGDPAPRQTAMVAPMLAVFVLFAGQLVVAEATTGPQRAEEGEKARMAPSETPARRGSLLTADGVVLAADVVRYEIQANPQVINRTAESGQAAGLGADRLAAELAPLVQMDVAELTLLMSNLSREWVPLVASATSDLWVPVQALIDHYWDEDKLDIGIYLVKRYERSYPAGVVAGNLVGYQYEIEEEPAVKHHTGLEAVLDDQLAGKPGYMERESGGYGQPIPGGEVIEDPAQPGCDVTLTIDSALQFEAQQAIQEQVEKADARAGMVVVMDVKTGEILALADSDTPDPANPSGKTDGYTNSRAVENIFEPGSTGKVVTAAMLIEEGLATPASQFTVPWEATIGGQLFHDSSAHETTRWTLAGIVAQSSNVGMVLAGQPASDETRHEYLTKFGFGAKTGVELPLEAAGVVHEPGVAPANSGDPYWDDRTRNAVLFGQGVSVNALQATSVFATLGNGGLRASPHLVKGVTCADGVFQPTTLAAPVRVVSRSTADQVVAMMEQVVEAGTGQTAQIAGYRVAGKTGTSEMFEDGGSIHVGSFAGVLPAEDPQLAVGVFIIDPKAGGYYGATVAGPVFEWVARVAVDRVGIAPSTTPASALALEW